MRYFAQVLDRKTGELVSVDAGDWVTMRELSEMLSIGRRQLTTVLRQLDFLQIEGTGKTARHRVRDWVIERGFGKRNRRVSDMMPFDVVSPQGVQWITERWEDAKKAVEEKTSGPAKEAREALQEFQKHRIGALGGQGEVLWIADHFPNLTHDQIAQALSVSRQLITRLMRVRGAQLAKAKALKAQHR